MVYTVDMVCGTRGTMLTRGLRGAEEVEGVEAADEGVAAIYRVFFFACPPLKLTKCQIT